MGFAPKFPAPQKIFWFPLKVPPKIFFAFLSRPGVNVGKGKLKGDFKKSPFNYPQKGGPL